MATFVGPIKDNQIILVTWVSMSALVANSEAVKSFNALLDTGGTSYNDIQKGRRYRWIEGHRTYANYPCNRGEPFDAESTALD